MGTTSFPVGPLSLSWDINCHSMTHVRVGISDRRGRWLLEWIDKAQADSFVVVSRDFSEFLGRLGFVSQV